jgi:hypothetical protein
LSTPDPIIVDIRQTALRKLYVCAAVALGVFVASISTVGLLSRGFDFGRLPKDENQSAATDKAKLESSFQQAAVNEDCRAAQLATQNALNAYQNTYSEMQDLIRAHFDQLINDTKAGAGGAESDASRTSVASGSLGQPVVNSAADQTQTVVNPQWKEMHDQLLQLEQRRAEMSATLQPTHPALEKIAGSIADLQKQLQSVPAMIAQPVESSTIAKSLSAVSKPQPADTNAARKLEMMARQSRQTDEAYRRLSSRLTSEKDACYTALDRESSAWQRKAEFAVTQAKKVAAELPVIPGRGGANLQMSIIYCGLLSLIVGFAVASAAGINEAAFNSAAQVRQILGLPVLGAISWISGQKPREQPLREAIWVRRSVLAAELILAACIVSLAISSIADHRFFLNLLADPFKACSLKFWC